VPTLRVTQDNVSQMSGSVLHPRYKTGLVATVTVEMQVRQGGVGSADFVPACGGDLRVMHEALVKALTSIESETQNDQRFIWTPTPVPRTGPALSRRMMEFVQVLTWADPAFTTPETKMAFALETPLPYAIDLTQQTVSLSPGTTIVTNTGTAPFWPVLQVQGPFSTFTLTNADDVDAFGNPLSLVYDSTLPGAMNVLAGHYAEIDTFRGTIFLDGNSSDLTAGLDPTLSDFWQLNPGANHITVDTQTTMLWNPAWA
jgi:hypothetical protein